MSPTAAARRPSTTSSPARRMSSSTTCTSITTFAKAGRVRPLGVSGTRRSPLFPDIPTIAEAGVPGLPDDRVGRDHRTRESSAGNRRETAPRNCRRPAVARGAAERFAELDTDVDGSTPREFLDLSRRERPRWAEVIKRSGAKLENPEDRWIYSDRKLTSSFSSSIRATALSILFYCGWSRQFDLLIRNASTGDRFDGDIGVAGTALRGSAASMRPRPMSKWTPPEKSPHPGFIDAHTHDDRLMLSGPRHGAESEPGRHDGGRRKLRHFALPDAGRVKRDDSPTARPARRLGHLVPLPDFRRICRGTPLPSGGGQLCAAGRPHDIACGDNGPL